MMDINIGWKSAENTDNSKSGLNHAGMENFKDDPLFHVPRELTQDALDAKDQKIEGPVRLVFEEIKINKAELPYFKRLSHHLYAISNSWVKDEKTAAHFNNMAKVFETEESIRILAVRDYNTVGLSHVVVNDEDDDSGWEALVKSSGYSKKAVGSNGTRGLGKHAPFLASKYNMLFYGTLNKIGETGFQGVAKLASYRMDGIKYRENIYYGDVANYGPITNLASLPSLLKREKIGTDKFIMGFNFDDSWKQRFQEVIIENFMWAIYEGKLEVSIAGKEVNQQTLKTRVEEIQVSEESKYSTGFEFYEALTEGEKFERKIKLKAVQEEQEIYLYLVKNDKFSNLVSMNRGSGMKIFDKANFRRVPARFSGFLVVKGEKLNELLSQTETATHKGWHIDLGKHLDEESLQKNKEIHKIIKEINDWISKSVHGLAPKLRKDVVDLKGIEAILPQVGDDTNPITEIDEDAFKEKIKSIKLIELNSKQKDPIKAVTKQKDKSDKPDKPEKVDRTKTPDLPKNSQNQKKKKGEVSTFRFIANPQNPDTYRLIIRPKKTGFVNIKIRAKGENGKTVEMNIKEIKQMIDGETINLDLEDNTISNLSLEKDQRCVLSVILNEIATYALEVKTV